MKVTLSAAMRARDVSRPRPEDEEAARLADGAPAANARGQAARTDGAGRAETRTGSGDRSGAAKSSGGRRRKRR